jgi:hypothetical protein
VVLEALLLPLKINSNHTFKSFCKHATKSLKSTHHRNWTQSEPKTSTFWVR